MHTKFNSMLTNQHKSTTATGQLLLICTYKIMGAMWHFAILTFSRYYVLKQQ